ncbi:MAG: pyruvate kinase [Nitrospinota bacterium]
MPRTKIVCTLGPASQHTFTLRTMIRAGMNVARLNFSHGTQAEHRATIRKLRRLAAEEGRPVAVLADLAGPKFRLGKVRPGEVLREGRRLRLVARPLAGTAERLSINRPELLPQIVKGHRVMIWDGKIQLEVLTPGGEEVLCRVVVGGALKDNAGINLPDTSLDIPPLTEKDLADIAFGVREEVDFFGLSFVRTAADVQLCRQEIASHRASIPIIAKMEMRKAVENLEEIAEAADGIMVARGDLGIETPLERVPMVQKQIIAAANLRGKPVITATEMLLSMVSNARPTRAEAGDVANAILDGTDAVMLSEETATGRNPAAVVRTMARIAEVTEAGMFESRLPRTRRSDRPEHGLAPAIAHTAVVLAQDLGASLIICPTDSGDTARGVALHRPRQPVLALSVSDRTVRRLALSWGVIPWKLPKRLPPDQILGEYRERILAENLGQPGGYVILTAGFPYGQKDAQGRLIQTEVL